MRRLSPILISLTLVVAACGGEARPLFGDGASGDTSVRPGDTSSAIVASLGARPGFDATLLAIDSGYTPAQLSSDPNALQRDGMLAGTLPAGSSPGLLRGSVQGIRSRSAAIRLSPSGTEHTLDEAWSAAEEQIGVLSVVRDIGVPLGIDGNIESTVESPEGARTMLGLILALMDVGYSFDQALNGYLFGEWVVAVTGAFAGCVVLLDETGSLVRPDTSGVFGFDGSDVCRDLFVEDAPVVADPPDTDEDPPPHATGDPVIYEGRNMWADRVSFDFPDGTDRSALWPVDIVLELYPDGLALIWLEFDDLRYSFNCNESYVSLVPATESQLVLAEGTHTDGRFEFPDIGLRGVTGVTGDGVEFANTEWDRASTSDACIQGPVEITRHLFFSIERTG